MKKTEKRQMSILYMIKRLFGLTKPVAPTIALSAVGGVVGAFARIGLAVFSAHFLAASLGFDVPVSRQTSAVLFVVCGVLIAPCYYLEQFKGHDAAYHLLALMRTQIFAVLQRLAPAKLTGRRRGDIISMAIADIETIEIFFAHTIVPIIIAIIVPITVLIYVASISVPVALVLIPFYLYIGVINPILVSKLGRQKGREYRSLLGSLKSYILDSLRGLKEVLIFRNGKSRLENIDDGGYALNRLFIRINRQTTLMMAIPGFFVQMARIVVTAVCAALVISGGVAIGESVVLIMMVAASFEPLSALGGTAAALIQTFGAAERVFALIDEEPHVYDTGEQEFPAILETIDFETVSFNYPGGSEEVLRALDLSIKAGYKVGIVGESGCGKTTLLRLLLRFWDPDSGVVRINGSDIRVIGLEKLYSSIAMLEQDTYLFHDTIAGNIALGKPGASPDEIVQAAKRACIHDFVMTLPDRYETNVGELGGRLSGGERQRIGIARTLLKDNQVLLFDEPTSNLDVLNEKGLLQTLHEEFSNKTIIMISHRESTLGGCNEIYRFGAD